MQLSAKRGAVQRAPVRGPVSAGTTKATAFLRPRISSDSALICRVSSFQSSKTGGEDAAAAAGAAPAPAPAAAADASVIDRLQLSVAHVDVDGAALPANHPDLLLDAEAARLIPADHPEAAPLQHQQEVEGEQQQQDSPLQASSSSAALEQPQQQPQQQQRHPRHGEPLTPTFAVGDLVWGEVVYRAGNGARVRLLEHEGVVGFMPGSNQPLTTVKNGRYRTAKDRPTEAQGLPIGHVRAFKVRQIPDNMTFHGHGPLLSASDADYDLAWARAKQAFELCRDHAEVLRVTVSDSNSGGLLASVLGLKAFIPFSALDKPHGGTVDAAAMQGKELDVAFIECNRNRKAVTLSERVATTYKVLRGLRPGSLVLGTVVRVGPSMAHIKIDGTRSQFTAHLHVSKFSCSFTRHLDRHLRLDDRVMALVVDVAPDLSRVELSTAHLEVNPGDMQRDPRMVYATADRQAEVVRRQMAEAAAAAAAEAAAAEEQGWYEPAQAAEDAAAHY